MLPKILPGQKFTATNGLLHPANLKGGGIPMKTHNLALESGVTVIVLPLSPYTRQLFTEAAREKYPDIDKTPYQKRVENSPVEMFTPAEDDPEYLKKHIANLAKRLSFIYDSIIDSGVVIGTPQGKEKTLAQYAPQLAELRKRLPGIPEDDWLATVKHFLIATKDDVKRIAEAANDKLAPEEVAQAVKAFRNQIQRSATGGDHPEATPSDLLPRSEASEPA